MTDKATARPWKVNCHMNTGYKSNRKAYITTDNGNTVDICQLDWTQQVTDKEQTANAELIVRAVNAHDGLVEALKSILFCVGDDPRTADVHDLAYTALKLAKVSND